MESHSCLKWSNDILLGAFTIIRGGSSFILGAFTVYYCIPADESMKDETPCKGILNFTYMTISFSRFIYFTCLHTSFLVQRDHTFWADQMFFYTTGYILPLQFYNHTCISNFMFHKSAPVLIFLRFTFIQIQVVFSSVLSLTT
jgi:hypothetical protein